MKQYPLIHCDTLQIRNKCKRLVLIYLYYTNCTNRDFYYKRNGLSLSRFYMTLFCFQKKKGIQSQVEDHTN